MLRRGDTAAIWAWRGWTLGVAPGALTNRSLVFTAIRLVLVLQIAQQLFATKQRVVP